MGRKGWLVPPEGLERVLYDLAAQEGGTRRRPHSTRREGEGAEPSPHSTRDSRSELEVAVSSR